MNADTQALYFICLLWAYIAEQDQRRIALERQSEVLAARLDEFYQAEPKQQARPLQLVTR